MKLNTKLLIIYGVAGLISLLVIGYFIEINLKQDRFQTIRESYISQLAQIDFILTDFLTGVEYDVSFLVSNELIRTRNDQDFTNFLDADEATFTYNIGPTEQAIIDLFNNYRMTRPYANSVYMGRENGSFVRSHPRNRPTQYDPRLRPWYQIGANNPDQVMRTAPYQSVTTTDVNIGTVKALVDQDGQVYGVVGIDVTLRNLTDYISDLRVGENGYVVLVDDNGTVLTSQDQETRFEKYDALGWDYFQEVMDSDTGVTNFTTENEGKYLLYYTSPALGWKICAVVPTQEIDREVDQFVNKTMAIIAFSLLLLGILATIGVRSFIVRPIKRLQQSTELIMQTGDLEHRIEIETRDEIGQLATSFNEMVGSIKLTEEELQKHREHLEELVVERTAELTKANEQLKEEIASREQVERTLQENLVELQARNEELDAFAHTVAHDLKNPAGIALGYTAMLEEDPPDLSDTIVNRSLQVIGHNLRKMDTIIDELLLLSSVRELKEIEIYPLNMEYIVREVQRRLRFLIEEQHASIVIPDSWPAAMGYGPWIEQVWANYISNALKYGGRPPHIELGADTQEDGWVRFWVRDNGPGLTPEEQDSLFTPFERLHQVRVEGHGLGLSIVRRIVHKLGGQVGVQSEGLPESGSTFYFTLPPLILEEN